MKTWNFYFYDLDLKKTTPLKYEIDEWKSFGINYGRETKTSIIKSYSSGFTFIKDDANFLKDIVYNRGFNARIRIDVYKVTFSGEKFEYSGFLDLSQCEMKGKTFNCPIDEGGFYNLLNNAWTDEFEFDGEDFKDLLFHGGYYQYVEKLGISKNENDTVAVGVDLGSSCINFLPLKKMSEGNKKLRFFYDAKEKTIQNNDFGVTNNQCFIISENKVNGGKLICDFKDEIGTVIINDYYPEEKIDFANRVDIETDFVFYFYNEVKNEEEWRVRQNLLAGKELTVSTTLRSDNKWVKRGESKVEIYDLFSDHRQFEQDITGYIQQHQLVGYKVAFGLRLKVVKFWKIETNKMTLIAQTNNKKADFLPSENFIIWYKNDAFSINQWVTIHGIYPSDLFMKFMKKINTDYRLGINLNLLKETEKGLLCSGTNLLGSINDCKENNVKSSLITTLDDLVSFIYKVYGLKLICKYKNGVYQLKFAKIEDCFQDVKIDEFTEFTDLSISCYTEIMYTLIKVGYKNNSDVIFGLYEFNTTNNFKTGNIELVNKELDLISPYTAGALDVETFIYENNGIFDDTKDGASQIYVIEVPTEKIETTTVVVSYSSGMFTLNKPRIKHQKKLRNVISAIESETIKSTINTYFTPKRILERHSKELSSYLFRQKDLIFISSEKNADFTFEEITENQNITLRDDVFLIPFILDVKIPSVYSLIEKIEIEPLGWFMLNMGGKKYKGFIADGTESISVNPMNEQSSTLKLILHPESSL